ncbi:MAG: acyl--CoA ligase, partial [Chloroflexi bacterium]|nr:acyl--CoA ligase [Chloroflexota bacterium]
MGEQGQDGQLYEIVRGRARHFPGAVALGAQDGLSWRTLDSGMLLARVDGLAAQLAQRGVTAGDRVVVWAPSGLRTPVYLFALWKLGAIVVPFDRDMNAAAAQAILQAVEPLYVVLGYTQRPGWAPADERTLTWWEPAAAAVDTSPVRAPVDDVAAVFFTSGTTGQPKGCTITHQNLWSQIQAFDDRI